MSGAPTRAGLVALLLACTQPLPAQDTAPELPELRIRLAPGGSGADGNPSYIDVTTTLPGDGIAAGDAFLRSTVQFASVHSVEYDVDDLDIADDAGPLPLAHAVDDPDGTGFLYWRRFTPTRDVEGTVTLRYRAPITLVTPRLGSGPPFDLRAQGGGLSGAMNTFLVMPDTDRPFMIDIDWNLAALAPGSIGITSFGEGHTRAPGPVDRLVATFLMAGPLGRFPPAASESQFSGFWVGEPRFDAGEVLAWSQRAYGVIAEFFEDSDPPPFRVFMRGNPYPGGGGSALMNSFLVSFPDTQEDATDLRETIAHETVHNWIGGISGPPGSTSWFSEGMTVYYTREILFRSGLFTVDEFLDSVNDTAASYYTNPFIDLHNDRVAQGFWEDAQIRRLPYVRGSLYFAAVDAAIREKTGGGRTLDDPALAFSLKRRAGENVDADTWRRLVTDELGRAGEEMLDAMLAGETVLPPSNAFGPCFERRDSSLRPFELGFAVESITREPRIVTDLEPGSPAARAGIEEGDEILAPVPFYDVRADRDRTLSIDLRRDGREFSIEYLPRGEPVPGYEWFLKPGLDDASCRELDGEAAP